MHKILSKTGRKSNLIVILAYLSTFTRGPFVPAISLEIDYILVSLEVGRC